MTLGLAQSCTPYVTTVINATDMVPTMSLGQSSTQSKPAHCKQCVAAAALRAPQHCSQCDAQQAVLGCKQAPCMPSDDTTLVFVPTCEDVE